MWGFRSKPVQEQFERNVCKVENPFICYSGIPEQYITEVNKHDFTESLRNFVYVGLMIDRKYPEKVLDALHAPACPGKPRMILLHTLKGKGVSFMEGQVGWHGKAPNDEQAAQALKELEG